MERPILWFYHIEVCFHRIQEVLSLNQMKYDKTYLSNCENQTFAWCKSQD